MTIYFFLLAANSKNCRNADQTEEVDIISVSGPNRLHFVHDSSIIVTSFNETEIAGISGASDVISGLASEVIEYQDHMDFIVKAVQGSYTTLNFSKIVGFSIAS